MLDLHCFRPQEVRELVREYVAACRDAGVLALRIVHGKGRGVVRSMVRAELERLPGIVAIREGGEGGGGWGATLVDLEPAQPPGTRPGGERSRG